MQTPPNFLIYLASGSPRRSELLRQIGVAHRVSPVDVDEAPLPDESPRRYVERLAELKADTLWGRLDSSERRPVLGADTTVALGSQTLGKPANAQEHAEMFERLSGRTHQVYTSVALRTSAGVSLRTSVSDVTFRALSDAEAAAYWRSGEPADKAGGYAVQGMAAVFIERLDGSYSGVVGLPLFETGELLQQIGWRLGGDATMSARAALEVGR